MVREPCSDRSLQYLKYIVSRDRIIHQDIKPANILIQPETKQVKLIDFSIASLPVIENAVVDSTLSNDPYILQHLPKSILCAPILNQGKFIGILYLENNVTVGAFTSDRLEILHLLISQAAISLENALLYTVLEDRVKERTQELNQKNDQLQTTLKELHRTQTQMLQSQKMSALGQLVAGIAHEINNPINFIHGNINYIQQNTEDLFHLLSAYQSHYPHPPQSLQAELDAVEFNFLKKDLHNSLKSMQVGSDRIRQIVLSLRNFARLDESEYKAVNLHEGIDNTLMILQHRLKDQAERPAIEIVKKYGDLPLVECYAREINQVFINLLINAIDALEESNRGRSFQEITSNPNRIWINTDKTKENEVQIIIADNGIGIPEQMQSRLFDPFFTTKSVGKGTGLGLSITYQIITEKHGGLIHVNSTPSQGTQFIITLPIKTKEIS